MAWKRRYILVCIEQAFKIPIAVPQIINIYRYVFVFAVQKEAKTRF